MDQITESTESGWCPYCQEVTNQQTNLVSKGLKYVFETTCCKCRRQLSGRLVGVPVPMVYCPKDKKKVPIWYCLGSFTQRREPCPYLVKATVHSAESAEVECKWKPEPPLYRRGRRRITKLTEGV